MRPRVVLAGSPGAVALLGRLREPYLDVDALVATGASTGQRIRDLDDVERAADEVGGLGDFVRQADEADLQEGSSRWRV